MRPQETLVTSFFDSYVCEATCECFLGGVVCVRGMTSTLEMQLYLVLPASLGNMCPKQNEWV